jgi:2-oxoglutarate ferredoxin oxidoreductase subunit gamma
MILAGFGGQGVMLMGTMITYAAVMEDKEATWMPSYGPEMRGGTANCTVIVSDKPIASPLATEIDTLVAMNGPSYEKFISYVKPGGTVFLNASLISEMPKLPEGVTGYMVDAVAIADKLKNLKVANMVMLGAIVRKTGIVQLDTIDKVMEKQFTGSKAKFLPLNREALRSWEE